MTLFAHTIIQLSLTFGGIIAAYWIGDTPAQPLATALLVGCGVPLGLASAALFDASREYKTER
jgi:hypothetical protein